MVGSALTPSFAVESLKFFGKGLTTAAADKVTTANISMGVDSITNVNLTLSDQDWTHLKSGIFKPGVPVDYDDLHMVVDSVDTDDVGGAEGITVGCRSKVVQQLKARRGTKVLKKKSPSEFIIAECKAIKCKYIIQPSARRAQVARDVAEKGQKYDDESLPSSWTTFKRFASELGYVVFEIAQVIFFGKPTWLVDRSKAKPVPVFWNTGDANLWSLSVPKCSRSLDVSEGVSVDVDIPMERAAEFKPGYAMRLTGVPTFDAIYLINSVSYDLAGRSNVVSVTAKTPINPEANPPSSSSSSKSSSWSSSLKNGLSNGSGKKSAAGTKKVTTRYKGVQPIKPQRTTCAYGVRGSWAAGFHTGNDYAARRGQRVYAVYDGNIVSSTWGGDYGNHVILNVPGMGRFAYCHLSRKNVKVGQKVKAGAVLGYAGDTGRAFGVHLHLEFRVSPYRYGKDCRNPKTRLGKTKTRTATVKYPTAKNAPSGTKSVNTFVSNAKRMAGHQYRFGAEVRLSDKNPGAFDCSELVQWAYYQATKKVFPDGTWNQEAYCKKKKTSIKVSTAYKTYGALLFKPGHVAISLGNGRTIEAMGRAYGVRQANAKGRGWTYAARVPGLKY